MFLSHWCHFTQIILMNLIVFNVRKYFLNQRDSSEIQVSIHSHNIKLKAYSFKTELKFLKLIEILIKILINLSFFLQGHQKRKKCTVCITKVRQA